jgi:hypothetical protein
LLGVAAVSPIVEVAECVRALERRTNVLYEWNFVRNLKGRMRRKDEAWPGRFPLEHLPLVRTVRGFDNAFTAPHFGFRDADDYYYHASAMRVAGRISVPAFILASKDDPFVPWEPLVEPAIAGNPHVTVELTDHGGHCGFISRNGGGDDYWAESRIMAFATALRAAGSRTRGRSPAPRA